MVTTIVPHIFIQKPFPNRSHMPTSDQISMYMFLSTFSGPIMVKMAKKYCFHLFHPKTISKQGSYAFISPYLKKYVFGPQKRIFDPFAHIFGPEKGQKSFSVIFIQKTFPKRGYIRMFHRKGFGSQKGLFGPFGPCFGRNRSK